MHWSLYKNYALHSKMKESSDISCFSGRGQSLHISALVVKYPYYLVDQHIVQHGVGWNSQIYPQIYDLCQFFEASPVFLVLE